MTSANVPGLVSTIIPVFNRAAMLRQAVDSVLAQSWPHIEILICDDGSTDDTVLLGRQLAGDDARITYLWNPNRGAGAAREAGRQQARGEFIQYLDSDDTLWPRKFERQIAALNAQPSCGAAYGWIRLCPQDGVPAITPHKWSGRELNSLFPHLLVDRWWNTNAPLWRRSVTDAIGPWSDLRYSQDWEYDARAGAFGVQLAYCPEFVTDQRHHRGQRQTGYGRWLEPPDRLRFFESLLKASKTAGVPMESSEMQHFVRWLFSHARQCAQLGDEDVAKRLFGLACHAAGIPSVDLRVYGRLSGLLGWRRTAALTQVLHDAFGRRSGSGTRTQSWMEQG